jgi:glycosyltransferase involved in cell wall biosynthesis
VTVGYVTIFDATDARNWSGLDMRIWRSLEAAGLVVKLFGNLRHGRSIMRRVRKLRSTLVQRKQFLHLWDTATAAGYAADLEERLRSDPVDVVVSPSLIPVAFLRGEWPVFVWTDAVFSSLHNFYPEFTDDRIGTATVRSGKEIERRACVRASRLVMSSKWAEDGVKTYVRVDPSRVGTIPFGANTSIDHNYVHVDDWSRSDPRRKLDLLFVGVDWDRKGGDFAVAVVEQLRALGKPASLHVVGARVPQRARRSFVIEHGSLDKRVVADVEMLKKLYQECSFFILPTAAECCSVAVAEACAHGLPTVSNDVGGQATVVENQNTGALFQRRDPPASWADWIASVHADTERYARLCRNAFSLYTSSLNWGTAGTRMRTLIESAM